jgi:hypothetical protein
MCIICLYLNICIYAVCVVMSVYVYVTVCMQEGYLTAFRIHRSASPAEGTHSPLSHISRVFGERGYLRACRKASFGQPSGRDALPVSTFSPRVRTAVHSTSPWTKKHKQNPSRSQREPDMDPRGSMDVRIHTR